MPVLEIHDLLKIFLTPAGEKLTVLDVPGFTLDSGAQAALRGSSGSGKTTLLHCIAGILAPDRGRIAVAGEDLTGLGEAERDRVRALNIGYIFQTFNLLQGYTALENVALGMMFGRGVDEGFARNLLERVGLGERLHYRPRQLSVGQQQRVAVARALANRPKLVLADEPTGNLDPQSARESLELIRSTCREQEAALLLVSHDREVLGAFERVEELSDLNRAMRARAAAEPSA
ncbi:MAG: ABC transporter ATP-binding protein [Planctomycetota bacterium]|nr:ABC transporter ATP-binding protein [Planctomycetota bacterium]